MATALALVLLTVALCVSGVPAPQDGTAGYGARVPAAPQRGYSVPISPEARSSSLGPPPPSLAEVAGGAFIGTSISDPIPGRYPVRPSQVENNNQGGLAYEYKKPEGEYGVSSIFERVPTVRYPVTFGRGQYRLKREAVAAKSAVEGTPRIAVSYKKPEGKYGVGSIRERPANGGYPVSLGGGVYRVKRRAIAEGGLPIAVSYKKPEGQYGIASIKDRPTSGRYPVNLGGGVYRVKRQTIAGNSPRLAVSYKKPEGEYGLGSIQQRPANGGYPVSYGTGLYRFKREALDVSPKARAADTTTTNKPRIAVSFKKPEGEYGIGSIADRPPTSEYPVVAGDLFDMKAVKKLAKADKLKDSSNLRKKAYNSERDPISVTYRKPEDHPYNEPLYAEGVPFFDLDMEDALRISSSDDTPVVVVHADGQSERTRRPYAVVKGPREGGRRGTVVKKVVIKRVPIGDVVEEEATYKPVLKIPDHILLPGDIPPLGQVEVSPTPFEPAAPEPAYAPAFPIPSQPSHSHNPKTLHKHTKTATPTRAPTTELVRVPTGKIVFNRNFASKVPYSQFKIPSGARSPYADGAVGRNNDPKYNVAAPAPAFAQAPRQHVQQVLAQPPLQVPVAAPVQPAVQRAVPVQQQFQPAVQQQFQPAVQHPYSGFQQPPSAYEPYPAVQQAGFPGFAPAGYPPVDTTPYGPQYPTPYPEAGYSPYGQDQSAPFLYSSPPTNAGPYFDLTGRPGEGFKS
ncbi:uncharacterized protein LOC135388099 [Ornithodoros turicata]|uniref:uncharacterized protein LOC135388099 n=1 Tax=Ornithodoros turicata TaxID=34597 RepID=UPI0031392505